MSQTRAAVGVTVSPFAVLRRRSFAALWSAELLTTLATSIFTVASGILVFRLTGSALAVGLVMLSGALPTLLLGLVAGAAADRFDRRAVLLASVLPRIAILAVLPWLASSHVMWLYLATALFSGLRQFYRPASESLIPDLATHDELAAANAFMGVSSVGARAVGFGTAGVLAAALGAGAAFYVAAAALVVAAVCVLLVSAPPPAATHAGGASAALAGLSEGFAHVFATPSLRSMFLIGAGAALAFGLWDALMLPYVVRALQASEAVYGVQEGATAIGFVVASAALAVVGRRLRAGQWVVVGCFGMALSAAGMAATSSVPAVIALAFVDGVFDAPFNLARRVLVQRDTTREVRGRVSAAFYVGFDSLFLVGMATVGLADLVPVRALLAVLAAFTAALGFAALLEAGLGQPRAEWRRALRLLAGAAAAPGLVNTRPAEAEDFATLARRVPELRHLDRDRLAVLGARTLVADAPSGTAVLRRGERSDAGYFVLEGRVVAGWNDGATRQVLEVLNQGDVFGEIAALHGVARTADVVAEEPSRLLQVPADVLRTMMDDPAFERLLRGNVRERVQRMSAFAVDGRGGFGVGDLLDLRAQAAEDAAAPDVA